MRDTSRNEAGRPVEPQVEHAVAAACRGEIVLLTQQLGRGAETLPTHHLILAAESISEPALARLLELGDEAPVLAVSRDRLEHFGLDAAAAPAGPRRCQEGAKDDLGEFAAWAGQLARNGHPNGRPARPPLCDVRCADWGGVVHCPRPWEAAVDLSRLAGLAPVALVCPFRPAPDAPSPDLTTVRMHELIEYRRARAPARISRTGPPVRLPTRYGTFQLQAFEDFLTGHHHMALWQGSLRGSVLTRLHSECFTGDLLGSLRCDCGDQLAQALLHIDQDGSGLLLYLRQEGRGIGLVNKLRSYDIQDRGFDTVEANEQLGFAADVRDYGLAAAMLRDLGVDTVRLLTNNPRKIAGLEQHGIGVENRVPLVAKGSAESRDYLRTKRDKLGHWLP